MSAIGWLKIPTMDTDVLCTVVIALLLKWCFSLHFPFFVLYILCLFLVFSALLLRQHCCCYCCFQTCGGGVNFSFLPAWLLLDELLVLSPSHDSTGAVEKVLFVWTYVAVAGALVTCVNLTTLPVISFTLQH